MWYLILTTLTCYDYETCFLDYFFVFENKEKLDKFLQDNKQKLDKYDWYYECGELKFGNANFVEHSYSCEEMQGVTSCDFDKLFNAHHGQWLYK